MKWPFAPAQLRLRKQIVAHDLPSSFYDAPVFLVIVVYLKIIISVVD